MNRAEGELEKNHHLTTITVTDSTYYEEINEPPGRDILKK